MNAFDGAMTALRDAGVPPRLRKPFVAGTGGHRELDLWVDRAHVATTDAVLTRSGFHRVRVNGHAPHRFYVTLHDGIWHKIDVKLTTATAMPRPVRSMMRRGPAGVRRYGPVIAVLGPDGAGKSTLLAGLERDIPLGVNVTYLGGGKTTAPGDQPAGRERSAPARRLAASPVGEVAFVARQLLRRARTLARAYSRAWTGTIVLCDRHPIETLAIDPRRTAAARRLERFVIERILPWPDVVVVLDAPPEVLFARKQEHALERLRIWRKRYQDVFAARGARFVATDGSHEKALEELANHVFEALAARATRRGLRLRQLGRLGRLLRLG